MKLTSILLFFLSLVLGCLLAVSAFVANNAFIDLEMFTQDERGKPTVLLDAEGKEWARFALDRREPVTLEDVPKHLLHAFIAAEDHAFFDHAGISLKGILRSTAVNVYHGRIVQGASTITQQLVKLLFFDIKKTWKRKIKEQWLSLLLERSVTKEQILQTYLNQIYFGTGIYGVEAASQRFWGKSASQLEPHESATLAGIVRSPGRYSPLLYPLSSEQCRNSVLHSMFTLGFIDEEAYLKQREQPIVLHEGRTIGFGLHIKEAIRQFLEKQFGKHAVYSGGLVVKTTISREQQKKAEQFFTEQIADLRENLQPNIDGALICMDVATGGIRAFIGGYDFTTSKFNRALQAKRQFGSIFKPMIYAAAITAGRNLAETEIDEPFEFIEYGKVWRPKNDDGNFAGEITLARALSRSNNIVTIKTLLSVGYQPLFDIVKKLHITAQPQPYPSIALGCLDGNLLEAVGMFNVFAAHGNYVGPHYIEWVKTSMGSKVWKHKTVKERVMEGRVADQVAKVLSLGINRYLRRNGSTLHGTDALGKTGTTNDSRTCWFAGSTPEYTTAIYLGCDDNRPLGYNTYAVRTAFPIWLKLYEAISAPGKRFSYDHSLQEISIDSTNGQIVGQNDPSGLTIFI